MRTLKGVVVSNTSRMVSARKLFAAGGPVLGTLAAAYLHQRGIARFGPALRYHPRVYFRGAGTGPDQPRYCPALLAKITDNQGNITGCARTYLDPNTGRIADLSSPKRILGQLHGNAVRFWSASDLADLIVGEGLENTLSVGTALPEFNLASCLTATHLGLFNPPSGIKRIWIARDNDVVGLISAQSRGMGLNPRTFCRPNWAESALSVGVSCQNLAISTKICWLLARTRFAVLCFWP